MFLCLNGAEIYVDEFYGAVSLLTYLPLISSQYH